MSRKERVLQRMEGLLSLGKGKPSILNHKRITSDLEKARKEFSKATQDYETANSELSRKQKEVEACLSKRNTLKDKIIQLSDKLRTMDLTGAQACRDRNDVTTYYVGNKKNNESVVTKDPDSQSVYDFKITPYRDWKRSKDSNKVDDEQDKVSDEANDSNDSNDFSPDVALADDDDFDDDMSFASDIIRSTYSRL